MIQNSLYNISGGNIGTISGTHTALVVGSTEAKLVTNIPEGQRYTIKYNANGGIQSTCPHPETGYTQIKKSEEDLILSSVKPQHSNSLYKFSGWAEDPNAITAKYAPGGTYRKNQDITLYAVWTKVTYTVTYLSNVSKPINGLPVEDGGIEPGTNYRIWNKPVPTGEGYTFLEWNTEADGSGVKYNPGDIINVNKNWVLYGIWNIEEYKLTYEKNIDQSVEYMPENEMHQYNTTFAISSSLPKTIGYGLAGWSTTPTGKVTNEIGSLYTMPARNITLYAVWDPNYYYLKYDKNSGNDAVGNMPTPASESHAYKSSFKLSDNVPTRTGYTFLGWSTNPSATSPTYQKSATLTMPANDMTLYAVWRVNTYKLTYNANAGRDTVSNMPSPLTEDHTYRSNFNISKNIPTRTGYTFKGWSTNASSTNPDLTANAKYTMPASDITLYAVWSINTYTLTYNANGGSGAPNAERHNYNTTFNISRTQPTRTGYTFRGWSTNASATTASFGIGASFTMPAYDVTLYAIWSVNTYTLTYNANGGFGAPAAERRNYGSTSNLSRVTPTRANYSFLGWSTSPSAYNATYGAGSSYTMPNYNVTLYAVWKIMDSTPPSVTITLSYGTSSSSNVNELSVIATISMSDVSGVATRKYSLTNSANNLGTSPGSYNGTLSSNSQTITLKFGSTGNYYLHVLAIDTNGYAVEKVSQVIRITQSDDGHCGGGDAEWYCASCGTSQGIGNRFGKSHTPTCPAKGQTNNNGCRYHSNKSECTNWVGGTYTVSF